MALVGELQALDPLLAPLAVPRTVRVVSDHELLGRVEAKPPSPPAGVSPKVGAPIPSVHGIRAVVPAEILMELAKASAAPGVDPGLERLSLQWAWIRYCWAFTGGWWRSPLHLSKAALGQTRHHKVITSEQLGIGFAIQLVRWALEAAHPGQPIEVHDADVVIDGVPPATWGLGKIPEGLRPDYFVEVLDPAARSGAPPSALYVLECKGTFSRSYHLEQLRKGMLQVAAMKDAHGNQLPGIVCSSSFDAGAPVTLRVLDPGDRREFVEPAPRGGGEARFERAGDGFRIEGEPELRRELAELRRASVLAFGGAYESARETLPPRISRRIRERRDYADEPLRREPPERAPLEGERPEGGAIGRRTRGVDAAFDLLDGSRLTIATEVDAEVLQAAESPDDGEFERAREGFAEALGEAERPGRQDAGDAEEWVPNLETEGRNHLRVIRPGGEILDLRLSRRDG